MCVTVFLTFMASKSQEWVKGRNTKSSWSTYCRSRWEVVNAFMIHEPVRRRCGVPNVLEKFYMVTFHTAAVL